MYAFTSQHIKHHSDRPSACRSARTLTVCVVDRHAEDFAGVELAEASGLRLEFAANPVAALRLAREQAFDLWVVNAELPGFSGYELCGMLKSRSQHAPVCLVANEYSVESERAAWQARATHFICKPGHVAWLAEWIAHRASQETPPDRRPRTHKPGEQASSAIA